ncbi:hypothetical protein Tco_1480950 [Tanacetum coccineum]
MVMKVINAHHHIWNVLNPGYAGGKLHMPVVNSHNPGSSGKTNNAPVPAYAGGTDNAKITRKWSKPDKHRHGNGKSAQEPEVSNKSFISVAQLAVGVTLCIVNSSLGSHKRAPINKDLLAIITPTAVLHTIVHLVYNNFLNSEVVRPVPFKDKDNATSLTNFGAILYYNRKLDSPTPRFFRVNVGGIGVYRCSGVT